MKCVMGVGHISHGSLVLKWVGGLGPGAVVLLESQSVQLLVSWLRDSFAG